MIALLTRLAAAVPVPLFIDSADPDVLLAALPCVGARGVANSVTLARGSRDLEALVPAVREHDARLVGLCIDEDGMAMTTTRKVDIAHRLYESTRDLGLDPSALIIDPLTFPAGSNREDRRGAARETLDAIRQIKASLPGVSTILGISDVSFGLPARVRPALNAAFLQHGVEAGLDIAIVNVATLRPYESLSAEERNTAEDLLFDRRGNAAARFTAGLR
jgi:5-methyltetrahydrofolate--homocysteine methyltransferase